MKKINILIVDDEELLRDLYEMILESDFKCVSTKVGNGNEAIEILKTNSEFDLIISDYNMPNGNGGELYLFNKKNKNIPFFLFSGGYLSDYTELGDFNKSNDLNSFFGKPFTEEELLRAVHQLPIKENYEVEAQLIDHGSNSVESFSPNHFIKVQLEYYLLYSKSAAEVYIKLSEEKYTKIINTNNDNLPDTELLNHYNKKGVQYIYIEKKYFNNLIKEVFDQFHKRFLGEQKVETLYEISGLNFNICFAGLKEIGINDNQISRTNEIIEETVQTLMNDSEAKERFKNLCSNAGFGIGHSMLIMYIAGRICHSLNLNFSTTMKKICMAAFYHDMSLFEIEGIDLETKLNEIKDSKLLNYFIAHPANSANFLPLSSDLIEDTKKIII